MFLRYLLPILVMLSSSLAYADTREHFNQLLAEIWAFELTADPVRAGRLGHHEFLDKLPDISAQGLKKHYQTRLTYLAQLEDVEQKNLNRSEQITWSIQHRELRNQIDLYRFNAHYMPINSEYGFHLQLSSMARSTQLKTKQQQQAYLARVKAITPYIQQQIAWMSKGIEQGYMLPKAAMVGFGDSIKSLITSSAIDNVFYAPAKKPNTTLSAEYQQQLQAEITNRLLPALVQLNTFYHEKYQVAMLQPVGINAIPQGKEFYQNRVAHYTTTQKTADEIHQVGLAEVSRIRSQMQEIIQSLEFDGEIPDFIHFLRTDPQFYATSVKQLIQYASYLSKKWMQSYLRYSIPVNCQERPTA